MYNPYVRSVALGVFVGAGVIREDASCAGISHFIEHMLFKGTSRRTAFDIVNETDSIGAQINAYTAKSYTCFHTASLDENADICADVLADMYFDPAFDEEELDKERRVVIEEINECEDTPDDVCLERLFSAFFKGHALETPILGTKKSLAGMTADTLRAYHKRWYVPENTVVSVVGNIDFDSAKALVERHFESKMTASGYPIPAIPRALPASAFTKKKKHIEQSHVAFAFPCYPYDDKNIVHVQLMSTIFGTEMSSRLFQSVREKLGLCYTVTAYPSAYENNGVFTVYAATSPQNAERAVKAIKHEIDLLLADGINDDELKKGKEQLKTSLVLGQEGTSSMMRTLGTYAVQTGKLYDFDGRLKAVQNATKEDVLDCARRVFNFDEVCASVVAEDASQDMLKIFKNA